MRKRQREMYPKSFLPDRDIGTEELESQSHAHYGVNHEAVASVISHYEAYRRTGESPRPARLVLVRTPLPRPVRLRQSAVERLSLRISRMLANEADDPNISSLDPAAGVELYDEHTLTTDEVDSEGDAECLPVDADFEGIGEMLPTTSIGISVLYAEEGDPDSARVWELGCWAGAHQLAGVDMFQVFLDVLTEATSIPSCPIDKLCIRDNLEVFVAVSDGVDLLKDLSAELHASYDKDSSYFLHPITGSRIEIVMGR